MINETGENAISSLMTNHHGGSMDAMLQDNRTRWNALAGANVMYSQPYLDFTREKAEERLQGTYAHEFLPGVEGKKVLLLGAGGGQDSVVFSLLGADVTVLDLSDTQLERDQEAARQYGYTVDTIHGDMRDLGMFGENLFDVVWQPYSINYVPTIEPVICEVARVLKPQSLYQLSFANPYVMPLHLDERDHWTGEGYVLQGLYQDGEDLSERFPYWSVAQPDGSVIQVESPHQYRHCLSTVLNTLTRHTFTLLHISEWIIREENPAPNSWAYMTQAVPPFMNSLWRLDTAC
jgi:SAM-dependent methyltransferase